MSTTKLLALLFLAAVATAEEPLLAPVGDTLVEFSVAARAERIKRGTAQELAASVAQLRRDLVIVNNAWTRLFRAEHLAILERYYAPALVKKQRALYRKTDGNDADVKCVVESVTPDGKAMLAWTVRDAATGRLATRDLLVTMKQVGAQWRIQALHAKVGGEWKETGLGPPPVGAMPRAPEEVLPDRASAAATIESLDAEMQRLAVLGDRGRHQLRLHQAEFVSILRGAPRKARPDTRPPSDVQVELAKPRARIGDVMRIEAVVTEGVPGTDRRSAIARFAFDLRPGKDGWRVVGELTQPRADGALEPAPGRYALWLILSRMR